MLQTDYSDSSLATTLNDHAITTIISVLIMDTPETSSAQLRLIRAAEACPSTTRFLPSEFNVEYDVPDSVLPYPEKRFHMEARAELAKTSTLEYSFIYPGMLMDYFGMPGVASALRPLCFFIDPLKGVAVLPGDGEAKMSMTFTTDAARYVVLALDLEKWERIMIMDVSTVTLNKLVALVEVSMGQKLAVSYQPVEALLEHKPEIELPTNIEIGRDYPERFPGGHEQLRALIADLEAGVALGAYDLGQLKSPHLDLVKVFNGKDFAPKRIEDLVEEAWKPKSGVA